MDRYEAVCLSGIGWNYEGIVCYSLDKDSTEGTAVYRLYNPNDEQHLYTTDSWEAGALEVFGWMREGVAWRI